MNYQQTVEYLFNSTPVFEHVGASAYKEGLSTTKALDAHFAHPHRQFRTIHVAGTNGKGSCSHTLAAILQAEGYKVGLYTSPHLVDFRERIRVNGQCISEEEVVRFVEEERAFFEPLNPSFFELTTALAFKYFAEQRVDIAVVEVGLGGRLDCTNIITPILSVITNISFDHTQFLGHTLAQIAGEKAGIIKPHIPVVIGETTPETREVFIRKATEEEAPIWFAEEEEEILDSRTAPDGMGRIYQTRSMGELRGDLTGDYQVRNMNTVLCAVHRLREMQVIRQERSIRDGIGQVASSTGLMGRWQCLRKHPSVVCDTGHNAGGWQYLSRQLRTQPCRQLRIVFGMVDDKDLETVMAMLPDDARYYWTQPTTKRAFPVEKVADIAGRRHLNGRSFAHVADAYHAALQDADPEDFIFVGGSSYIVADLLAFV
ncbi:MAG: bifunctional folylpolyglutamate synthase/dihydrofolate synthase [Prevotella sp.]|nr:bifunctional folylpolyglutamate synthase/dihydrofolate synthase [Prevotella sp.]